MVIIIQQTLHRLLTRVHQQSLRVILYSLSFLLLASTCFGSIGRVSFQSQPAQITRGDEKILTQEGTLIEMDDVVETLNGAVHLVFEDNTKVKIKKYSELVIDDFVYEPSTKKGKLNLKASIGNIRYTSGLIANKENIKISTPTASVSVRGTDINITVVESGQSSFTLLPSTDSFGNEYTGQIEVSNISGSVILTVPFQNTVVTSSITPPSQPAVLSRSSIADIKRQEKEDEDEDSESEEDNSDINMGDEELADSDDTTINEEKLIVDKEGASSIFSEIDNRIYFISDENQNKVSISFDPNSSVSVNYENQGKVISGNHNNGGQVIININQQ